MEEEIEQMFNVPRQAVVEYAQQKQNQQKVVEEDAEMAEDVTAADKVSEHAAVDIFSDHILHHNIFD